MRAEAVAAARNHILLFYASTGSVGLRTIPGCGFEYVITTIKSTVSM
jgi:hypothetical protein